MRSFLTIAAALAVSVFGLTGAASGATTKDSFGLKGEVYAAGFKIEMKNAANRKLTSVKAGTYQIKIEDKATIHNFRLSGPGVNKATAVPRKTETIWTVRLKRGTYTFLCDPHANNMRGTFRVA